MHDPVRSRDPVGTRDFVRSRDTPFSYKRVHNKPDNPNDRAVVEYVSFTSFPKIDQNYCQISGARI